MKLIGQSPESARLRLNKSEHLAQSDRPPILRCNKGIQKFALQILKSPSEGLSEKCSGEEPISGGDVKNSSNAVPIAEAHYCADPSFGPPADPRCVRGESASMSIEGEELDLMVPLNIRGKISRSFHGCQPYSRPPA
jgi:hypothetical protein